MSKMNDMAMTIEELRNAAAAINDAADWLAQQFGGTPKATEKSEAPVTPAKPALTLEEVRAVLADKSRAGHTAEIRELLKKYGASKLSLVDPKHYEDLLRKRRCSNMPPKGHTLLSASSSDRWLHCPPSARLCETYEDKGSDYAAEGTDVHALCEYKLRKALGMKATDPTKKLNWYNAEMEDCATGYASFIMELLEDAKQICSDPVVLIEQRVDFSRWVEQGFGTSDAILISDGTMHVIDYKHGLGILVSAEDNPQMKCYALGALELFDDIYDIDTVSMIIYQPRRQNISTYEVSKEDLYQWADEVLKPTADLAFAGDGNFLCGEWCGFCKAKHECRARAEANLLLAQHDFKLPPLLTDSEIEVILSRVDELVSWANDIKEYALQQAISGKEWTGWKLVEGRSNRRYTNEDAVSKAVEAAGFDPYEKKLLGITAMQKLLGKSRFEELLAAYIEKPQGKPTLVPESDKRPAMNTAKNDFMEEYDNE